MKTYSMIGLALLVTACAAETPVSPTAEEGPNWAAASPEVGTGTGMVTGIGGTGIFDVEQVMELTLQATRLPDGSGVGFARFGPAGPHGRVIQVVPPAGERAFWCITAQLLQGNLAIYIRDSGDGITGLDQVVPPGLGADCTLAPDPSREFVTLLRGDYMVRPPVREVRKQ